MVAEFSATFLGKRWLFLHIPLAHYKTWTNSRNQVSFGLAFGARAPISSPAEDLVKHSLQKNDFNIQTKSVR
jgi:hypothetical protein